MSLHHPTGCFPLCGRFSGVDPDEAAHVVVAVDHPDLQSRLCKPDGADEEAHALLLIGEDMLER